MKATIELTMEQKHALCKAGEMDVNDFIAENKRFIHLMLKGHYCNSKQATHMGLTSDDYFQAAQIGIWKAYESYDSSKGTKWFGYATRCVTNEIRWMVKFHKRKQRYNPDNYSLDYNKQCSVKGESEGETSTILQSYPLTEPGYEEVEEKLDQPKRVLKLRASLSYSDQAIFDAIIQNPGGLMSDIGEIVGKSQSWVSRRIKVIRLKYEAICQEDVAV